MEEKIKAEHSKSIAKIVESSRGITLIALVITIIVLLILAAVSIATLTGENGILTRAGDSKTQTEIGEEEEAIRIAYNGVMADNLGDGVTAGQLQTELQSNGYSATATGENPIVVTFGAPSNRVYEIDASGNIAESKPPVTLDQAKADSILDETTDTKVQIGDKIIKVPAGFRVADDSGATIDEGIVITDAPDGEVGNEFVWVPVEYEKNEDGTDNFDEVFVRRAGYSHQNPQDMTNYGEANAEGKNVEIDGTETGVAESSTTVQEAVDMYASVKRNEGFYIGRYEAGTNNKRKNGDGIEDRVVVQKGANVYNYVGWSNNDDMNVDTGGAVQLARNFDTANGYETVTSTLCYGVQWDVALAWIEKEYTGFSQNSSGMGWHSGVSGNEDHQTGIDLKDGDTVKNMTKKIYDLAGNVMEWTMESYNTLHRVRRGGNDSSTGTGNPASDRNSNYPSRASNGDFGFRVTLFLNS